jgi:hypothetical protein
MSVISADWAGVASSHRLPPKDFGEFTSSRSPKKGRSKAVWPDIGPGHGPSQLDPPFSLRVGVFMIGGAQIRSPKQLRPAARRAAGRRAARRTGSPEGT